MNEIEVTSKKLKKNCVLVKIESMEIGHTTRNDGYTLGAASIDILYIFRFGMMSRFQNYAQ